jgi:hypothetical protein
LLKVAHHRDYYRDYYGDYYSIVDSGRAYCILYIVARIQYFTLSLIKHCNAMIIFFVFQAFHCIYPEKYMGEDH